MIRSRDAVLGAVLLSGAVAAGVSHFRLRGQLAASRADSVTDALTGICNRRGITADLARRVAGNEPYALVMVDLDEFKAVNDSHGHAVGDAVLVETARRLSGVIHPPCGLVGRLGGDEFAVLASSPMGLMSWWLAQDVVKAMRRPITIDADLQVRVTASVGVLHVMPGDDVREVMHSVDEALYAAKAGGRNRVVEYTATSALAQVQVERPRVRLRDMGDAGRDLAGVAA